MRGAREMEGVQGTVCVGMTLRTRCVESGSEKGTACVGGYPLQIRYWIQRNGLLVSSLELYKQP